MNQPQYFAHRPASTTTLLHDPWTPDLRIHKALKPKVEPRPFPEQNLTKTNRPWITGLTG